MYNTERDVKKIQSKLEALQSLLQDMIDSLQKADNTQSSLNINILSENALKVQMTSIVCSRELAEIGDTLLWLVRCEREYLDDKRED